MPILNTIVITHYEYQYEVDLTFHCYAGHYCTIPAPWTVSRDRNVQSSIYPPFCQPAIAAYTPHPSAHHPCNCGKMAATVAAMVIMLTMELTYHRNDNGTRVSQKWQRVWSMILLHMLRGVTQRRTLLSSINKQQTMGGYSYSSPI